MDRTYFLITMIFLEEIEIIFRLIRIFFESEVRLTFDSFHLGIFDSSYSFFVIIFNTFFSPFLPFTCPLIY